jgi:hypothetical protein
MLLAFMVYAERHYRHPDGSLSSEIHNYKLSLRPVQEMYAHTLAEEFGPKSRKAVRQWMIERRWCRNQINARINRIRRVFKWAESEELVPAATYQALATVEAECVFGYLVKPIKEADLQPAIAVAMRQFELFQGLRQEADGLRQALEDRKLVERAKGVLMQRSGTDEADAYRRLQKLATDKR